MDTLALLVNVTGPTLVPGPPPLTPELVQEFALSRLISMAAQTITLTILLWEYVITFSDEVDRIWNRPWTGASILFLINRYLAPAVVFVDSIMAFDNALAQKVCVNWVRFQGSGAIAVVGICEVIMILRVYALYGGNKTIATLLGILFAAQIVISAFVVAQGVPTATPFECILIGRNDFFVAFWATPLITEACIFGCTLWRSKQYVERQSTMPMLQLFLRDGCGYFGVVFLGNVATVTMFLTAQGGIKAFFAPIIEVLTSVMVSRLVLNLRGFRSNQDEQLTSPMTGVGTGEYSFRTPRVSYMPSTISNGAFQMEVLKGGNSRASSPSHSRAGSRATSPAGARTRSKSPGHSGPRSKSPGQRRSQYNTSSYPRPPPQAQFLNNANSNFSSASDAPKAPRASPLNSRLVGNLGEAMRSEPRRRGRDDRRRDEDRRDRANWDADWKRRERSMSESRARPSGQMQDLPPPPTNVLGGTGHGRNSSLTVDTVYAYAPLPRHGSTIRFQMVDIIPPTPAQTDSQTAPPIPQAHVASQPSVGLSRVALPPSSHEFVRPQPSDVRPRPSQEHVRPRPSQEFIRPRPSMERMRTLPTAPVPVPSRAQTPLGQSPAPSRSQTPVSHSRSPSRSQTPLGHARNASGQIPPMARAQTPSYARMPSGLDHSRPHTPATDPAWI